MTNKETCNCGAELVDKLLIDDKGDEIIIVRVCPDCGKYYGG